jgi:NNP family nitrate/nitrite transporter-like MFS transporter
VDRIGAKKTGILAQLIVIAGLLTAWSFGLPSYAFALALGFILGFAGASFAVALPQAGRLVSTKHAGSRDGISRSRQYWSCFR